MKTNIDTGEVEKAYQLVLYSHSKYDEDKQRTDEIAPLNVLNIQLLFE
jgi:hypothetical protein